MSPGLALLAAVIVGFGILTALTLAKVGVMGIVEPHLTTWGGAQVFFDLVIVCTLACIWMVQDGRARGVNAWPFVVLTLMAGSFGPLAYLVKREFDAEA